MADQLAEKIRKARKDADLSREELAAALGVSLVTVVRIETGRTMNVSAVRLLGIAKATKKPLAFFLGKAEA
jgi:transcriptional regulator with XRE-family HTH domain